MQVLSSESNAVRVFEAFDFNLQGEGRLPSFVDDVAPPKLSLCRGARVILTRNLRVSQRLVNGACGVIVGFAKTTTSNEIDDHANSKINCRSSEFHAACDPHERLPVVKFDHLPQTVTIERYEYLISDPTGQSLYSRIGIPLKLAWVS